MSRLAAVLLLVAALSASVPASEPQPGAAAILDEPGMPAKGAPASPEVIATILRDVGIRTHRISLAQLVDPKVFNGSQFDLLVVPCGRTFPVEGHQALVDYLRGGGHLITLGGYAFEEQVRKVGGRWVDEAGRVQAELEQAIRAERSLVRNGGFEQSQELPREFRADGRWHPTTTTCQIVQESPQEGRWCGRVANPPESAEPSAILVLELPVQPGTTYRISGWMRAQEITGPGMAYMAVYQHAADGRLADFQDFAIARQNTPWQRYEYSFAAAAGATRLQVKLGLYNTRGTAWFDDTRLANVSGIELRPINTSRGRPRDGLETEPSQIGIFDASFPLARACRLRTAPGQRVVSESIDVEQPLAGWAASGIVGYDNARWAPLVEAYDRFGRPRGAAGAMTLNYGGFYAGSWWAYFGVENVDLFHDARGPMGRVLGQAARFMVRGLCLHNLATDRRLYEPGESVTSAVVVENRSAQPRKVAVSFDLRQPRSDKPFASERREVTVPPKSHERVSATLAKLDWPGDLFEVTARLQFEGGVIDELRSGLVVRRPEMVRAAPELRFQDNYFTLSGRPTFLFGSDTYGCVYQTAMENPLTWSAETAAARDIGMNLYEILQPVAAGHTFAPRDWRTFHALDQLVEKQGLVFMPGMLIGHNVAVGEERLAEESRLCAEYARQFAESPAFLYYINGDYVMRLDEHAAEVGKLWNQWLQEKYGSSEQLKKAWPAGAVTGELGSLKFPPPNSGRWDDVAAVDQLRFQAWLTRRWNQAHVAAVRQHDRRHPITSEFYQRPSDGIDTILAIDGQDVSNIGYFDAPEADIDGLPLKICWNDLRARGKGVSLGEYGVKTHPAWSEANVGNQYQRARTETQQKQLFLAVAHYGLGLGASKVQNWCLRDDQAWVFPWGLFYPNQLVPKEVAYVHRNLSVLWRHFRPRYEASPLTVCLANALRTGNEQSLGSTVGYQAFGDLLALHRQFNVIDDDHLDQLPPATRVLWLPSPMATGDEAYRRLADWVRQGGTLVTSGDLGYDADRQRSRASRLSELGGVEFVGVNYPNVARSHGKEVRAEFSLPGLAPQMLRPCVKVKPVGAEVLGKAADGQPVLVRNRLGKGTVYWLTDPMELSEADATVSARRAIAAALLAAAQVQPLAIESKERWLHVMEQPTATGRVHVVYNTRLGEGSQDVTMTTAAGRIQLTARNRWPALAAVADQGRVVAVESDGAAVVDGKPLVRGAGLKAILSLDGVDLRQSEAILVAPFETGQIELPGRDGSWVAMVGEFQNGRWIMLEAAATGQGSGPLEIDADRATCLIVLCRAGSEKRWAEQLNEAMVHPERIAGY